MPQRILYFRSCQDLTPLAEACFVLTPQVFLLKKKELYLDIFSTQKILGGERQVLEHFKKLLYTFKLEGEYTLTDHYEWARTFSSWGITVVENQKEQDVLLNLPLESLVQCGNPLQIEKEEKQRQYLTSFMRRVGMCEVKDFTKLSPQAIERRFGKVGLSLLESIYRPQNCPFLVFSPTENICERLITDELTSLEQLLFLTLPVLQKIEKRLQGRSLEAQSFKLDYFFDSLEGKESRFSMSSPTSSHLQIHRNLKQHLQTMTWEAPLQSLTIEVTQTVPFVAGQLSLLDLTENKQHDIKHFISHMQSKFGKQNAGFFQTRSSYLPENAFKIDYPNSVEKNMPLSELPVPLTYRPYFIYRPAQKIPEPYPSSLYPTESLWTEWWDFKNPRQYFITPLARHQWGWVYLDLLSREWFLHGLFD